MSIFNYQEKPGYFRRLREALSTTTSDLSDKINELTGGGESPLDEDKLEELEAVLMTADLGVETTLDLVDHVRDQTRRQRVVTSQAVRRLLRSRLIETLKTAENVAEDKGGTPHTILVVGVNGVGKTTSIGKLAAAYRERGERVMLCASDTFRAAAIDQLKIWADRTGSAIVSQQPGSDPAAVLFDALAASRARDYGVLIVDTAGRLHNKANLMAELEKMSRVAGREVDGAPHEVLLIIDATTGQNGLVQAREFLRASAVTGIIVTKLDGTAKGGIVVAIARELKIPIRWVGVGEGADDLLTFDAEAFVDSLFESGAGT